MCTNWPRIDIQSMTHLAQESCRIWPDHFRGGLDMRLGWHDTYRLLIY